MALHEHPRNWAAPGVYWGALGLGFGLAAFGLLMQRFDLVLIGMPLLLTLLLARKARPERRTQGEFRAASSEPTDVVAGPYVLSIPAAENAEYVQVRMYSPGHQTTTVVTEPRDLPLELNSKRTGPHSTFSAQARGYGHAGMWIEEAWDAQAPDAVGMPTSFALGLLPPPKKLRGLTGARHSRRIGDGGELRDIAPMRPGDSLRRVDWRATGRRSPELDQLYVRRTFSNAEGIAELVIDSRDDVGPDLETWRGTGVLRVDDVTSLDLARHAAASVAAALIAAGDRVGLEDLAHQRRPVASATGQRQLRRIQQALALSAPHGRPAEVVRPPRLPADAVIYLFSTLLDDTALKLTAGWVEQGNPVIVVDTLPRVRPGRVANLVLAWRIMTMEREDRIATLRSRAIPVIPWQAADSLVASTELTKIARAQAKTRGRR